MCRRYYEKYIYKDIETAKKLHLVKIAFLYFFGRIKD